MRSTRRFRLLSMCPLLALLMLGCGSDDNAEATDGGSQTLEGQSDAGGGGAANTADGSAGSAGGGSSSADSGAGGGSSGGRADAGLDASSPGVDASSNSSDAGKSDAGKSDAAVSTPDASGLARFSFFVTSEAAIRKLSANPQGFGGDLRYGETGDGAGLRGADKLCAEIADSSMPGASAKQWRAFLSAATGGASGGPVNARDRIGTGPWYDRMGRLVGNSVTDLLSGNRPSQADAQIRDDLPNETGTPNHAADGTQVDNHDTLTGSDAAGRYVAGANTCEDWTSSSTTTSGGGGGGGGGSGPAVGHSWPRTASSGMNWVSDHRAGGCGKGISTVNGGTDGTPTVGSGGGYGGFYCFALAP